LGCFSEKKNKKYEGVLQFSVKCMLV
jgi:hypothetical protein